MLSLSLSFPNRVADFLKDSIGFVKGEGFPGPGNIEVHYNSIGFVKGKGKRKILQSTRALQ